MKKMLGIIILSLVLLTACSLGEGKITFGLGNLDEGITNAKSTFSQADDFILELDSAKEFGASEVKFLILQESDGLESVYDEWYDSVDPTWNYFLYEFQVGENDGAFDSGNYILRVYVNESDLIAEGKFSIE